MENELERELRSAMRDEVDDLSASRTLADTVIRRHRRRTRRLQAVTATAFAALAVAALPVYRTVVPGLGPERPANARLHMSTSPTPTPRTSPSIRPPSLVPRSRHPRSAPSSANGGAGPTGQVITCDIAQYVPTGLSLITTRRPTVGGLSCRWAGSGGANVSIVVAPPPASLATLAEELILPRPTSVHGSPAFVGSLPNGDSEVVWVDHMGDSVTVEVTSALGTQLMSIANGVAPK